MAKNVLTAILAVAAAVFIMLSATGELAAAKESLCKMTGKGFVACLPSVTGESAAPPSDKCCTALSKADLPCLCKYKDSPELPQLGINPELAKQLPAKCKLSLPSGCM